MAGSRASRVERRGAAWATAIGAAALVVLAAVGAYQLGYLNDTICEGPCPANFVGPPESLVAVVPSDIRVRGGAPTSADPVKVEDIVQPLLDTDALGNETGFTALDLGTGQTLWTTGEPPLVPASTNKLFTTFAALTVFDARHRFRTSVRLDGTDRVVLVGGGDPYLQSERPEESSYPEMASIPELAQRTAEALQDQDIESVEVSFDDSLFSGPAESPDWEPSYIANDITTPVSPLWVDRGIENGLRPEDPAAAAAEVFADELAALDIEVADEVGRADAPDSSEEPSAELAAVAGPTVGQIIELVNVRSDNEAAEVLFRHVGLATDNPGSFAGGRTGVESTLESVGIVLGDSQILDGSGLSRDNRATTALLARTLFAASQRERTKVLLARLPVAGFVGTLADRFDEDAMRGLGLVRAKTGTLSGVHGLAGVTVDADGNGIIFAALGNETPETTPLATQDALDQIAAALTACECG